MQTAIEAYQEIQKKAEQTRVPECRIIQSMSIGQVVRQGDIYIHAVKPDHLHGKKALTSQLAIGETKGSRHIAESPSVTYIGTTLPEWCRRETFIGPMVKSESRFIVSHPEHAHISFPAGCYMTTHQLDARTLARVKD